MKPTSRWLLPIFFAVAGGLVYVLVTVHHSLLPDLSVGGPVLVLIFGLAVLYLARGTRARLAGRPRTKPINPLVVARFAALGKASAVVGAPLGGIYAGLLGRVAQLDSPVASRDLKVSVVGVVAGVLLAVAGILLETVCRVKSPPPSGEA